MLGPNVFVNRPRPHVFVNLTTSKRFCQPTTTTRFCWGDKTCMSKMARTFGTPQWVFLCLLRAQYINVFANIITHPLRVTIASYFCQRLQQLLSLNVFHHYASRCSRRYMQPGPTHARRKPMQPIPVPKVSCRFLKNVLRAWPKRFR